MRPYGSPLPKCNIICLSFFLCYYSSFSSFLLHCSFFIFSSFFRVLFSLSQMLHDFFFSPFLCSLYFHFPFINPSLYRRYFFVVVSTSSKSVSQMPYIIFSTTPSHEKKHRYTNKLTQRSTLGINKSLPDTAFCTNPFLPRKRWSTK